MAKCEVKVQGNLTSFSQHLLLGRGKGEKEAKRKKQIAGFGHKGILRPMFFCGGAHVGKWPRPDAWGPGTETGGSSLAIFACHCW